MPICNKVTIGNVMRAHSSTAQPLDMFAIGISGLCLLHCLALPLVAGILPVFGAFAEQEWAHKSLVLLAAPVSLWAIFSMAQSPRKLVFSALVLAGLALLIVGAFVEAFHDYETVLTVAGALIISTAHLFRWSQHIRKKRH